MAKSKLATPAWILEGYDSPTEYNKAHGLGSSSKKKKVEDSEVVSKKSKSNKKGDKVFKVKKCPKCGSYDVEIVLSNLDSEEESNTGKIWKCKKCGWQGENVKEEELTEEEFMKYLDDKGEAVS